MGQYFSASCFIRRFKCCATKVTISKMSRYMLRLSTAISQLERAISKFFGHGNPPAFCVAGLQSHPLDPPPKFSLKDLIGDGFLWAVPKHRRTVEKRLKRRFGDPKYILKIMLPKNNITVCNQCGHDRELGVLCPHCYGKVRAETEKMQDKIQEQLGLEPVDQEVVVLYDGEKKEQAEFLNGKRIVEMEKPRPMWFSKNLLQKSTQQPATTKDVKPNELG